MPAPATGRADTSNGDCEHSLTASRRPVRLPSPQRHLATRCCESRRNDGVSELPEALWSSDSDPKIEQQLRAAIGRALMFALATGGAIGAAVMWLGTVWTCQP
jgi:hypothetical protein